MKKLSFLMLTAALCLSAFVITGCNSQNSPSANALANTKWQGTALQTELVATFTADECYIQASGYANGVAVGSYKTSNEDLFITITTTSGDFDGQLNKGDILIGVYNKSAQTISLDITLYGRKTTVVLTPSGATSTGTDNGSSNGITAENAFGTWVCTYLEEHYMENGRMTYEVEDGIFYRMILSSDYTYQVYENGSSTPLSGQWSLSGDKVTFTINGSVGKAVVQELTAKRLVLRIDGYSSTEYEVFFFDRQ